MSGSAATINGFKSLNCRQTYSGALGQFLCGDTKASTCSPTIWNPVTICLTAL